MRSGPPKSNGAPPAHESVPWLELGTVVGVFGVRGELRLNLHHRESTWLDKPRRVRLVTASGAREVTLHARSGSGRRVIGTVEGLEDRDAAEALNGARIEVDPATLPKPAKGEYYVWQVVGLPVVCDGAVVGSVHEVHGTAGGDVFEVTTATGSVFVPSIRQYVVRVDVAEGVVELVTGALDACEA